MSMNRKDGSVEDNMIFDDGMGDDPCTPAITVRKDGKQTNKSMNWKDGSVEDNMIIDDKVEYDLCTPTNRTRNNRGITDEITDRKDESLDDNLSSDSQTHRKVSRDPQSDTSSVIDDPRQGGRLKYSERKETESGISETSPTKEVTSNNVSSNIHTPAGRIRKDNEQQDEPNKQKEEIADPNMTVEDEKSYDCCNSAIIVSKDS